MEFDTRSGVDILPLIKGVPDMERYHYQKEVLLRRGTRFTVKGIEKRGDITYIRLEEER